MGDASGVGPEIAIRAFKEGLIPPHTLIFGDTQVLRTAARKFAPDVQIHQVTQLTNQQERALNVKQAPLAISEQDLTPGRISKLAGNAACQYVKEATEAARRNQVSAIVTLPMNKEATQLTHNAFSGHTELLAELCDVDEVVMMLATAEVAVSHVSTHVSLRNAIESLTPKRLQKVIELTHSATSRFINHPRIGVCGLNPHAGESGMFGDEEQTIISPVISKMRRQRINVSGPYPADTVFRQAIHADQFDALICMYHDQGHAPMKLLAFDHAVNVTLGLPIIRTSVDHGTAFDIAWKGVARLDSLYHAIQYAQKLTNLNTNNRVQEPS